MPMDFPEFIEKKREVDQLHIPGILSLRKHIDED